MNSHLRIIFQVQAGHLISKQLPRIMKDKLEYTEVRVVTMVNIKNMNHS